MLLVFTVWPGPEIKHFFFFLMATDWWHVLGNYEDMVSFIDSICQVTVPDIVGGIFVSC